MKKSAIALALAAAMSLSAAVPAGGTILQGPVSAEELAELNREESPREPYRLAPQVSSYLPEAWGGMSLDDESGTYRAAVHGEFYTGGGEKVNLTVVFPDGTVRQVTVWK